MELKIKIDNRKTEAKAFLEYLKKLPFIEIESGLNMPAITKKPISKKLNLKQQKIMSDVRKAVKFVNDVKLGRKKGRPIQDLLNEL